MIRLTKKETYYKLWTVKISGETWRDPLSKTEKVSESEMQPGGEYLDKLIILKSIYDKGFMNGAYMYDNLKKLEDNMLDTFGVEIIEDDVHDLIYDNIPYYDIGSEPDFVYGNIDIEIKDGDGNSYSLDFDNEDVVEALKRLELAYD